MCFHDIHLLFRCEINTAGKCWYISAKTRPLTPPAACSRPLCPYPQETRYVGARTATLQMRPIMPAWPRNSAVIVSTAGFLQLAEERAWDEGPVRRGISMIGEFEANGRRK
jgi:hypothetical protein